jgi:hypothetical protein
MIPTGKKQTAYRRNCLSATVFIRILTWSGLELTRSLRGEMPALMLVGTCAALYSMVCFHFSNSLNTLPSCQSPS